MTVLYLLAVFSIAFALYFASHFTLFAWNDRRPTTRQAPRAIALVMGFLTLVGQLTALILLCTNTT